MNGNSCKFIHNLFCLIFQTVIIFIKSNVTISSFVYRIHIHHVYLNQFAYFTGDKTDPTQVFHCTEPQVLTQVPSINVQPPHQNPSDVLTPIPESTQPLISAEIKNQVHD